MEYIIRLSEDYEKCKRVLNKLGIVAYKSPVVKGLIGYWSKLDIEYLEKKTLLIRLKLPLEGRLLAINRRRKNE